MKNKRNDEKLKNFLPLNRKFFDHPFWNEKREYSKAEAWLDLLQMVNFKETEDRLQIGSKTVRWTTGQVPISYRYLATRWQWGHGRIKTFLDLLTKEGMISLEIINSQTILTLLNFQKYNKPGARSESSNPHGSAVSANTSKSGTPTGTQSGTPTGTQSGTLQPAPVLGLTKEPVHQPEQEPEQQSITPTGTKPEQDRNKSNNVLRTKNTIEREEALTPTQYGSNREPSIPAWDDVRRAFFQNGGTEEMAEKFYNNYESTGWYKNGSPIRNFVPLVGNFIKTYTQIAGAQGGKHVSFALNKEDKNSYV